MRGTKTLNSYFNKYPVLSIQIIDEEMAKYKDDWIKIYKIKYRYLNQDWITWTTSLTNNLPNLNRFLNV